MVSADTETPYYVANKLRTAKKNKFWLELGIELDDSVPVLRMIIDDSKNVHFITDTKLDCMELLDRISDQFESLKLIIFNQEDYSPDNYKTLDYLLRFQYLVGNIVPKTDVLMICIPGSNGQAFANFLIDLLCRDDFVIKRLVEASAQFKLIYAFSRPPEIAYLNAAYNHFSLVWLDFYEYFPDYLELKKINYYIPESQYLLERLLDTKAFNVIPVPVVDQPLARTQYIEFIGPLWHQGLVMIVQKAEKRVDLRDLFLTLSPGLWLFIFLVNVIFAFCWLLLYLIEHKTLWGRKKYNLDVKEERQHGLSPIEPIFDTLLSFFLSKIPVRDVKNSFVRLIYIQNCTLGLVLITSFACAIYSNELNDSLKVFDYAKTIPFSTLEELLSNDQGYNWYFIRNSESHYIIENESPQNIHGRLYHAALEQKNKRRVFFDNLDEAGLTLKQNPKAVLIVSQIEANYILAQYCGLIQVLHFVYL
ncbi:hypothetical protein Ciccas_001686 [Cichlidogyrus casuarinus]|uniref:Uncharacterized protein n=1 Tax=Cichlidogyrus casuarinus TaxID=1844966 RepID=A0ABD2QJM3_9PLAT